VDHVENQFIVRIRREQDFQISLDHHIEMFAGIAFMEEDVARIQIDNIHFLHQTVEFIRRETGKKWNTGK
jgi:hypothetical protein